MTSAHRVSMARLVLVCLLSLLWNDTLAASGEWTPTPPAESSASAQAGASETPTPASRELVAASDFSEHAIQNIGMSSAPAAERRSLKISFDAPESRERVRTRAPLAQRSFEIAPFEFNLHGGQIYAGPPYPMYHYHHNGAIAAIMVGAAAAITGTAVLVYANRPECSFSPYAGGCGYGTKVVGSAVLSGGIVSLFVGALIW
jgi:hypothetical protein